MRLFLAFGWWLVVLATPAWGGPYSGAPAADGDPPNGSDAVSASDPRIQGWAAGYLDFDPGPRQLGNPDASMPASYGLPENALGAADATSDYFSPVVSLGDRGRITLTFGKPIADGAGADFAVYENSFNDTFLELAFVEVSSDNSHFVQFPSVSLTSTAMQVNGNPNTGSFGSVDPTNLWNLAGKYRAGYGTPFDLADLRGLDGAGVLDFANIRYVRIVDVVGSIDPAYGSRDSQGHLINDPWPTPYMTSGFDLDAVAILNTTVPEPGPAGLITFTTAALLGCRRRRA